MHCTQKTTKHTEFLDICTVSHYDVRKYTERKLGIEERWATKIKVKADFCLTVRALSGYILREFPTLLYEKNLSLITATFWKFPFCIFWDKHQKRLKIRPFETKGFLSRYCVCRELRTRGHRGWNGLTIDNARQHPPLKGWSTEKQLIAELNGGRLLLLAAIIRKTFPFRL